VLRLLAISCRSPVHFKGMCLPDFMLIRNKRSIVVGRVDYERHDAVWA
jgi:hypothetical protein